MKTIYKNIVLVHGAWYGSWCWKKVIQIFKEDRNVHFNIKAVDLPRYSKRSAKEITLKQYVKVVNEAVEDLGGKAIIIGHSMAGIILSQFAEWYPDKVEKLIYLSAFYLQNGQSLSDILSARKSEEKKGARKLTKLYGKRIKFKAYTLEPDSIKDRFFDNYKLDFESWNFLQKLKNSNNPIAPLETPLQLGLGFNSVEKAYISCWRDKAVGFEEQKRMLEEASIKISESEFYQLKEGGHSPFYFKPML